jgi:hypothetical protein
MTFTLFAVVVVLAALLSSDGRVVPLHIVLCLFGASSVVEVTALGGATITPAVAFLPVLVARALSVGGPPSFRSVPRAGFWLALSAAWGALGALLVPRLLQGRIAILTSDRSLPGVVEASLVPLHPVSGNVTQTGYAIGAAVSFFAFRRLLLGPMRMPQFAAAVMLLTALNGCAALLNLGEFYFGLPNVLALVRNANYAIFDTYEYAGLARIQGTFSETSAFCTFTLPLFAFTSVLWLRGWHGRWSGALALASLAFLLLSTSGTAYVALAAYGALAGLGWARRGPPLRDARVPRALVAAAACLTVAIGCALVFELGVVRRMESYFSVVVLQKMHSESGMVRATWNRQAWSNFVDTYGLGVGLGSARASSFALVLLSNLGLVGTALYVAFLVNVLRGAPETPGAPHVVRQAARHAVLAAVVAACVSGAVFDLGVAFYAFAAAATVGPPLATAPNGRNALDRE